MFVANMSWPLRNFVVPYIIPVICQQLCVCVCVFKAFEKLKETASECKEVQLKKLKETCEK